MVQLTKFNRRDFLRTTVAAGAALAAPSFAGEAFAQEKYDGKVLVGLSGGGSWRDSVDTLIGEQIRAGGGEIDYVIDAPQANIAKLFAARGGDAPFDVLESGPHLVSVAAPQVQAIDFAKIPNAAALPDYAKGLDFVWNCSSQDGIVYNKEMFEKHNIPLPKQYKDLAHPALKGKVAMPDVNHVQHWNAVVGMAYDGGGDEASLEKAIPIINEIKPAYFYATSTDMGQKMASGEIWAAAWHAGWAVRLANSGTPVGTVFPEIGSKKGALWPVILQVTRSASNADLGAAFIDLYLEPEVQAQHAKTTGVVPVHPDALAEFAKDPIVQELMLTNQSDIDNLHIVDFSKIDQAAWRERWNKDIVRG
jgi:spermidine/putrescine-binding protein